jgi:hypothetical protein
MGLFRRSLARRMRRGPTLLLPEDPGDRLLSAVRRFDPKAEPGDGFIELTFCLLTGPIEATPEDGAVAYLPEHASDNGVNANLLVDGLAHLLSGERRPPRPPAADDMWLDPVVSVFTADPLPPDELLEVAAPYVADAAVTELPLAEYGIEGDGPISIEYGGITSYDVALPPPTLREPRARYECGIFVQHDALPLAPDLLHRAGELALAVAARTDGVTLDIYGFRIDRPEDVHVDTAAQREQPARGLRLTRWQ